ncbi:MAG: tetratricopeptide repeat protein, partial [Candidatus Kapabacteria bacterium]|nr:tetratricopeptide repeat protein [Candidatus Kapabacteria bacterium]
MYRYFLIFAGTLALTSCSESVHDYLLDGNADFADSNYTAAAEKYANAVRMDNKAFNPIYNLGCSYYAKRDYNKAADAFAQALEISDETGNMGMAYYNLANSYFRMSQDSAKVNPLLAFEYLNKSLNGYKNAMIKLPNDQNAKMNYLFVKKILENMPKDDKTEKYKNLMDQEKQLDKQKEELDKQQKQLDKEKQQNAEQNKQDQQTQNEQQQKQEQLDQQKKNIDQQKQDIDQQKKQMQEENRKQDQQQNQQNQQGDNQKQEQQNSEQNKQNQQQSQ